MQLLFLIYIEVSPGENIGMEFKPKKRYESRLLENG